MDTMRPGTMSKSLLQNGSNNANKVMSNQNKMTIGNNFNQRNTH